MGLLALDGRRRNEADTQEAREVHREREGPQVAVSLEQHASSLSFDQHLDFARSRLTHVNMLR